MPTLNRTLLKDLTTREITVDQDIDGNPVTVRIRPIEPMTLMELVRKEKSLAVMAKRKSEDDITDEDIEALLSGDLKLGIITDIVREVMADPVVVDNPTAENEVSLREIAGYQLTIFHAAMELSGFGSVPEKFRGNVDSSTSSTGGEGVRRETVSDTGTDGESPVATAV